MERNRDGRKASTAAGEVNGIGLSRRRHRITALRDSPEDEEGQVALQETFTRLRERERVQKERDQVLMSQSKRRKPQRTKDRDVEGGGGVEDSFTEESFEEDDVRRKLLFQPESSSSSMSYRRTLAPTRTARSLPVLRGADEMIGVPVPRRARSASLKMLNKHWNYGMGGFGDEQNHRRASPSLSYRSVDSGLPSSSNVPLRKKMRAAIPKNQIPKVSPVPHPSVQDDIEIEVAEALFDLMTQSQSQPQSSKKDRRSIERSKRNGSKDKEGYALMVETGLSTEIKCNYNDQQAKLASGSSLFKLEKKSSSNIVFDGVERIEESSAGKGKYVKEQGGQQPVDRNKVVPEEEESPSSAKSNADDLLVTKTNATANVVETKGLAKFEIDLMAPPPMSSSPERDGMDDMVSDTIFLGHDAQINETVVKEVFMAAGKIKGKNNMETTHIKEEMHKFDLEKPQRQNVSCSSFSKSQQRLWEKPNRSTLSIPGGQNFGQSNSLPSPTAATSWPSGFPHQGYIMPPLQPILPVGNARSSAVLQLAPFSLSQPRQKRCVTHQYIAQNIHRHQQLTKNCMWPVDIGPATLYGAKPYSLNPTPSQGDLGGKLASATTPIFSVEGKNSQVTNTVGSIKSKQLVLRQELQQAPTSSLLHGPTVIFPLGQNQVLSSPANESGPAKSATLIGKASLPNTLPGEPLVSSSSFPLGAPPVSFNCSSLSAKETPQFMAIMQTNGYSYSMSTNGAIHFPLKGSQGPILPLFSTSYPPPMFHITQNQQESTTRTANTSTGSSSRKQSQNKQQIGNQSGGYCPIRSPAVQLQYFQKQHIAGSQLSSKSDKEMRRQDGAVSVDIQECCAQKASDNQSFAIPVQPMNFAVMANGGQGSGGGNHHSYQEKQGTKYGVEVIPPQTIALSFGSTATTAPTVNFPSLLQNPAVFQMLPDVGWQEYQFVSAAQVAQHKNMPGAERKSLANSVDNDDGKRAPVSKSPGQSHTLPKFDCGSHSASTSKESDAAGSPQTRSCLPSPSTGNQPSASSTAITAAFSVNTSNSQQKRDQQGLIQLQKQHIQQMQLPGTAQVKALTSSNSPYSFLANNFPNNNPIFSPAIGHNNFVQSSQWKNASISRASQVPSLAILSSLRNLPQQQIRNSKSPPRSSSNSATTFQGQQIVIGCHPPSSIVDGSSCKSCPSKYIGGSGNMNTTSEGSKAGPMVAALPPQQTDTSGGMSQKPSPVCGRNVPSILSTSHSQLPELK